LKRIIRLATHDEVSLLHEARRRRRTPDLPGRLASGLPMTVVDAEYQFDRHKLTFFRGRRSCRLRELVRDLFSMYKTRI
jgi:cell fate regulator YaaT (PSP1 superfamily)